MDSKSKSKETKIICPLCERELNVGFNNCRIKCECGWSADISIKPHDPNQTIKLVEYVCEILNNDISFNKYLHLAILKDENTFYHNEFNNAERKINYLYDYATLKTNLPKITFDGNLKGYKRVVYYTPLEGHEEREEFIKKEIYFAMKKSIDEAKSKVLSKINSIEKEMGRYINEN